MRTGRSGVSPVMVGRDDELHRLTVLADGAHPGVALVAGEPGVGKSRLVQELVGGRPAGTEVLVGQADPGALGRPYELLLDALDGHPADVSGRLLAAIGDQSVGPSERLRVALDAVAAATGSGPSIVVFEDLHWADPESVALFERIADLPGRRLLVGTYRPDDITRRHPVAELLNRLDRRHSVTHMRLERLSLTATSAFLGAVTGQAPSYRTAVALHNRTGGNPFFLEELLKAAGDDVDLDQMCSGPLPWNLAEALRRQLDELEPAQQRVVEAAAVLGRKVPFDLLAVVTGAAEDELITTLRDLVRRGLLIEIGDDEFGFRHALAREAIAEQMLGRQRRRLHELALETLLATRSADMALVAHHANGAGRYDDMVAAVRRGCAVYLAIGSAYQALQLAELGLDEVPDDVQLLSAAARAAWLAWLPDDGTRYAKRWLEAATTAEQRAAALSLMVRLAWENRNRDQMIELTEELRGVVEQLPMHAERARAMAVVAQAYMLRNERDEAIRWAEQTMELAERLALPDVRLAAMVEKGSTLVNEVCRLDEGRLLLTEAADEAEKAGEWLLAARALNNLFFVPYPRSANEFADLLERMRTDAEKAGLESLAVATYYQGRARLAMQEGDLDAATRAVEEARWRDQGAVRSLRRRDFHGVLVAGLALEGGNLDLAESILAGLRTDPNEAQQLAVPGLAFHLACRRGDVAAAERELAAVLRATANGRPTGDHLHDLVAAAVHIGLPPARLRDLVESGFDEVESFAAWGSLVEAQLAEAEHRPAEALDGYVRAAQAGELPPAPRGSAHAGAARCLLALGRVDEARAHVLEAAILLARWSGWRVAEVEALRARVDPQDSTVDSALTPREREVARLLAEGLTNAELARRLYISPKTAAVHVSSILSKLELSSRTQVGEALRRAAS